MANYISDFNTTFNIVGATAMKSLQIIIQDDTDYASYGETKDNTYEGFVTSIVDPQGFELHPNTTSGTPDLVSNVFPSIMFIPEGEDKWFKLGQYTITLVMVGGGNTYSLTRQFTFDYERPKPELGITDDCVDPLLTSEDITGYDLVNYTKTTVVTNTIVSSDAGTPDVVVTGAEGTKASTTVFYTEENTFKLDIDLTYESTVDLKFTIHDSYNYEEKYTIIDIGNLCEISDLVNDINRKYQNARSVSASTASRIYQDWTRAVGLLVQIREALTCGDREGLIGYAEEIRRLAEKCECDCGNGTPMLVEGLSAVDNNTVTIAYAEDSSGTGFSLIPTVDTEYFALLTHNKNDTPTSIDFAGLWMITRGDPSFLVLGVLSTEAYYGDKGKIAYDHSQEIGANPHNVAKSDLGLDNVDNTSDLSKIVSLAQLAALNAKVDDSQVLTNVPVGAVFTDSDTIYDDTAIQNEVNLNTAKTGITTQQASDITTNNAKETNIAHPLVETAVPLGALFTDTVHTPPAITDVISTFLSGAATDLVAGDTETFEAPYDFILNNFWIAVTEVPTTSSLIVDVKKAGVSVTTTKAGIDATEFNSLTGTAPVLTGDLTFLKGTKITPNIFQVGSLETGKSLKIYLEVTKI